MFNNSKFKTVLVISAAILCLVFTATAIAGKNKPKPPADILTEDEVAGLKFMREEEKLARDSYIELFGLWGNPIFDNISESEQKHTDAIENLILQYGLEDPVEDESVIGGYKNEDLQKLFDDLMGLGAKSETDALIVGAMIEETDILDIQHEIELAVQDDIISTYESLLCGSRNHLRAFVGQLELNGVIYEPKFMVDDDDKEEFLDILEGEVERDCGTSVSKGKRSR